MESMLDAGSRLEGPAKPVETASSLRDRLNGLGFYGAALDLAVKVTAPARAAWREEQARTAVMAAARSVLAGCATDTEVAVMAKLLLWEELIGRGGPAGCGSMLGIPASPRAPWASGLGSGRRHARDGEAWDAALLAVSARLDAAWTWGNPEPIRLPLWAIPACYARRAVLMAIGWTPTDGSVLAGAPKVDMTPEQASWLLALEKAKAELAKATGENPGFLEKLATDVSVAEANVAGKMVTVR